MSQNNFTVSEVAKELRVSERTVLREIKRGKLKAGIAGRRYLISSGSLDSYLKTEINEDL